MGIFQDSLTNWVCWICWSLQFLFLSCSDVGEAVCWWWQKFSWMLVKAFLHVDENTNVQIQTYSPTYMFFTNVHSFYQTLITEVWKNLWRHEKWNSIIKSWWIFSRLGSLVFLVSAVNDIRSKNLIIFYIWPNLFGFSVQSGWFSGQLDGWFIRSEKILFVKYTFASSESFATIDKINGINHPLLYKRFSIVTLLQGIFTILLRRVF